MPGYLNALGPATLRSRRSRPPSCDVVLNAHVTPPSTSVAWHSWKGFLAIVPVNPFGLGEARAHLRIGAELVGAGTMIGVHDLLIAATVLVAGSAVAMLNVTEFVPVLAFNSLISLRSFEPVASRVSPDVTPPCSTYSNATPW